MSRLQAMLAAVVSWLKTLGASFGKDVEFGAGMWEKRLGLNDNTVRGQAASGLKTIRAGQISDRLIQFVVVGFVILVGILLFSEFQSALPTPSNNELDNASTNATNTFADSMELAPLVILVGVAGLLLAVIRNF